MPSSRSPQSEPASTSTPSKPTRRLGEPSCPNTIQTARAAAPGGPAAAGGHAPGLALLVLATAQLIVVLDATIVNVRCRTSSGRSAFPARPGWVVNAYALTFGGLLLLGGRTGDLLGRRRCSSPGCAVLRRLAGRRVRRSLAFLLTARACRARRHARRPGRADADHHHLRRPPRAPGRRRVRRDEHRRLRHRPDGGGLLRPPSPRGGRVPVRQRAHRRHRRAGRPAGAGRVAAPPRPVRPARRDHRHRRGHRPGLRPDDAATTPDGVSHRATPGPRLARRRRASCSPRSRVDRDPQPAGPAAHPGRLDATRREACCSYAGVGSFVFSMFFFLTCSCRPSRRRSPPEDRPATSRYRSPVHRSRGRRPAAAPDRRPAPTGTDRRLASTARLAAVRISEHDTYASAVLGPTMVMAAPAPPCCSSRCSWSR